MLSQRDKDVCRVYGWGFVLFLVLVVVAAGIVMWHPVGWLWSLIAAALLYVFGMVAVVKVIRRLRRSTMEEGHAIELEDKVLGLKKEPPKNWYFLP